MKDSNDELNSTLLTLKSILDKVNPEVYDDCVKMAYAAIKPELDMCISASNEEPKLSFISNAVSAYKNLQGVYEKNKFILFTDITSLFKNDAATFMNLVGSTLVRLQDIQKQCLSQRKKNVGTPSQETVIKLIKEDIPQMIKGIIKGFLQDDKKYTNIIAKLAIEHLEHQNAAMQKRYNEILTRVTLTHYECHQRLKNCANDSISYKILKQDEKKAYNNLIKSIEECTANRDPRISLIGARGSYLQTEIYQAQTDGLTFKFHSDPKIREFFLLSLNNNIEAVRESEFITLNEFLKTNKSSTATDHYQAILKREYKNDWNPIPYFSIPLDTYDQYFDQFISTFIKDFLSSKTDYQIIADNASRNIESSRGGLSAHFAKYCIDEVLSKESHHSDAGYFISTLITIYYSLGTVHANGQRIIGVPETNATVATPRAFFKSPRNNTFGMLIDEEMNLTPRFHKITSRELPEKEATHQPNVPPVLTEDYDCTLFGYLDSAKLTMKAIEQFIVDMQERKFNLHFITDLSKSLQALSSHIQKIEGNKQPYISSGAITVNQGRTTIPSLSLSRD